MQRLLVTISAILLLAGGLYAQGLKEKLGGVKGNVQKVVIQTDSGSVTLEGKDAADAVKRLTGEMKKKVVTVDVDTDGLDGFDDSTFSSGGKSVIIINGDTLAMPDFSMDFNGLMPDSLFAELHESLKGNMHCLKEEMKNLRKKIKVSIDKHGSGTREIIIDTDDADGDNGCCDKENNDSSSKDKEKKVVKKKVIIKKDKKE